MYVAEARRVFCKEALGSLSVAKIIILLSHPDDTNYDDEFAVMGYQPQ